MAKEKMSATEKAIREEAKRLGIECWWNKNLAGLNQEVLDKKAGAGSETDPEPVKETEPTLAVDEGVKTGDEKVEKTYTEAEVKSMLKKQEKKEVKTAKTFNEKVKEDEEEGNKGFKEAAKEESLFAYATKDGNRIGLWRRIKFDVDIKPYEKDTSYQFVRWSDEPVGTVHAEENQISVSKEDYNKMQAELEQLRKNAK